MCICWTDERRNRKPKGRAERRSKQRCEPSSDGPVKIPTEILEKTFEEIDGYDEMNVLRDIRFESHCEHHIAPIIGRAWVAYIPDGRVVGISKLPG